MLVRTKLVNSEAQIIVGEQMSLKEIPWEFREDFFRPV